MKFQLLSALVGASLAWAVPTLEFARGESAYPPDGSVKIVSVSYVGTGCPAKSAEYEITDKADAFTLAFGAYVAEVGPGIPRSKSRANCQVMVKFSFPAGFQYGVANATYKGHAALSAKTKGISSATYYFTSSPQDQVELSEPFYGPMDKDYIYTDTIGVTSIVYSPCGEDGILQINSAVRLESEDKDKKESYMQVDSQNLKYTQVFGITWRRC